MLSYIILTQYSSVTDSLSKHLRDMCDIFLSFLTFGKRYIWASEVKLAHQLVSPTRGNVCINFGELGSCNMTDRQTDGWTAAFESLGLRYVPPTLPPYSLTGSLRE